MILNDLEIQVIESEDFQRSLGAMIDDFKAKKLADLELEVEKETREKLRQANEIMELRKTFWKDKLQRECAQLHHFYYHETCAALNRERAGQVTVKSDHSMKEINSSKPIGEMNNSLEKLLEDQSIITAKDISEELSIEAKK
jgi:hypothetical protein